MPEPSGKNPILERGPRESKSAAMRLKHALQTSNSLEHSLQRRGYNPEHAELTDEQQAREVGEAHDAVQFHNPHSPEGGRAGEIFQRDGSEKASADFSPDPKFVEDEESRGLPQWPDIFNDSRDAGQGDEPTSRAWAEHDSFRVTDMPNVENQGNPGPSG